jgi:hypothetical protein
MSLRINEDGTTTIVEGTPGEPFITAVDDTNRLVEECFSSQTSAALLYAENLPDGFFDLSTGKLGAILQKLRNYGVRLAVVTTPGTTFSEKFEALMVEERKHKHFGVFDSRSAAIEWLAE